MLIGRYLQWVETAPVAGRIDAARALADLYADPDTPRAGRCDAELALLALLDDGATVVRRALAEAVSFSADVPRTLVIALSQDHSSVSVPVLRHSPLLGDADLVDAAAIGDAAAQAAIAARPHVSLTVAAALAEVGDRSALVTLCDNPGAEMLPALMLRMLERFGDDADLRGALLDRDDLDPTVRHDLMTAATEALTAFATACEWMSTERAHRVARECRERGTVTIAVHGARGEGCRGLRSLAVHLRQRGYLTPALILRALLSGNTELLEAALSELSGMLPAQVAGHVRSSSGLGFAALYKKARLPAALLPVFRAALACIAQDDQNDPPGALRPFTIRRVMRLCEDSRDDRLSGVTALLRRLEAEALREEARSLASAAWSEDDAFPALMPWVVGASNHAPRLSFEAA